MLCECGGGVQEPMSAGRGRERERENGNIHNSHTQLNSHAIHPFPMHYVQRKTFTFTQPQSNVTFLYQTYTFNIFKNNEMHE